MPVLEKCFQPFSDEEAFANLSKNIFGERRENKLQTTFWPGTDEGCRRVSPRSCSAHEGLGVPRSWWASAGPLAFLTQGQGDSPEKQAPVRSASPENCSLIENGKGCLSSSLGPGEKLLTGPDL